MLPHSDIVRDVLALVTAHIATGDDEEIHDGHPARILMDHVIASDPALTIPVLVGSLGALVVELAEAQDTTPEQVWQLHATALSAALTEGDPT
jgi:hypothetical protein